jgi:hypothetical protein
MLRNHHHLDWLYLKQVDVAVVSEMSCQPAMYRWVNPQLVKPHWQLVVANHVFVEPHLV